ncbi:hypothetical protein [Lactococcus cremoris]|uniref:hypothetical protein n=1 Tax=Lactococcus lactis subsp. cremoris TaxID=1359 RepID=UPI0021A9FAAA|nr:hypothetical protein [Lactococcus cremoris]
MKKFKIGSLVALLLGLVLFTGLLVNADEFTDIGSLYDKAVSENIINPNLYPKANWEKDEISIMRPSYEEYKNYDSSITYESWLKLIITESWLIQKNQSCRPKTLPLQISD